MSSPIQDFNDSLAPCDIEICNVLSHEISKALADAKGKIWHRHPVWFLNENPTVGYSKQKRGIRLMFWSGADFGEEKLSVLGGKFKDASIFYKDVSEIDLDDLNRWLQKSKSIQWDYKNLIRRKGKLEKLK